MSEKKEKGKKENVFFNLSSSITLPHSVSTYHGTRKKLGRCDELVDIARTHTFAHMLGREKENSVKRLTLFV